MWRFFRCLFNVTLKWGPLIEHAGIFSATSSLEGHSSAAAAWSLSENLWSLAVMLLCCHSPQLASAVSLLSQLPAMHVVHFIFQIALISEECFLFQTSPFLCDKETYFFFLLTGLCSLHSLEDNFTNSPWVRWQHNYHLTWQLFPWILNIQNTSKGTGGIQ